MTIGKAAIVTGASRGIGAAVARLAATRGFAVCVNYLRDERGARAVVDDIVAAGGRAIAVRADVSREAEIERLFATSDAELGPLGSLVNNAGVLDRQTTVAEISEARLERILRVNTIGPFLCAKHAVRRMSRQFGGAGGTIVNVGSAASRLGSAGEYVDYAASKGAIDSLTIGLSNEVAPYGIRVNTVRPGYIRTDIHASGGEPGRVDRLAPNIPLRRGGDPLEVARAVIFLMTDDSSYTTGNFIDCAGGR
jgi:NAD(P)-dependent dehydrogenase (short-subunit alcohol dehydrogenase family)